VRRFGPSVLLIAAYAVLLLAAVLAIPLRIDEILQIMGGWHHSLSTLVAWIAQTPASAPLNYFIQWPFIEAGGHSRLAARLPSLLFALASCYVFLRLVKLIPLRQCYPALLLFMLLPVQYQFATRGRPLEQALFLLLLATICYFRLLRAPDFRSAALYAGLLLLCLYTDRSSYLPAIGYLLFLLRFVNTAHERRVIWFALPATIVPVLLFLPYYFWAHPQVNPNWLLAPTPYPPALPVYLQTLFSVALGGWNGYIVAGLLAAGTLGGAWYSFRPDAGAVSRRIPLFCLFGGVVSTIAIAIAVDAWNGYPFSPNDVLWAAPGMIVLSFAVLEWLARKQAIRPLGAAAAVLLIVLCAIGDANYLRNRTEEDFPSEAAMVAPELTGNSCVVFVSEGLSPQLFLLFDPSLEKRECLNFFHDRVVLASHPYVRPSQQEDAESYFRGLNFIETKRIRAGGGQIVVMEQSR